MMKEILNKLVSRESLEAEEAEAAMDAIMSGDATPAQIGALLAALRTKGEAPSELLGFARAMRAKASPLPGVSSRGEKLVDTCGTGGDGANTLNISTIAALVLAGGEVKVAKHGNRSISSRCGSADVLEALGVRVDLGPEEVGRCLREVGIGFLFAPVFHPAMKNVAGPRRELGIRTVFNVLGPLTNPAFVNGQVLGVYDPSLNLVVGGVLAELGVEHAMVVYGMDGLDEISISAPTLVCEVKKGSIRQYVLDPESVGVSLAAREAITGGDAAYSAARALSVLKGEKGPARDVILLNSAAGFVVAGLAGDVKEGMELARRSIDSGAALAKLEALKEFTQRIGPVAK